MCLSLDVLRAAVRNDVLPAIFADLTSRLTDADVPLLAGAVRLVAAERERLAGWAGGWQQAEPDVIQAGMRDFSLRLGRAYTAALLCEHAAHRLAKHDDDRAALVARRYANRWLGDRAHVGTRRPR